jgi:branched-subunit amino acid ABC-type transport system permease component
MIFVITAISLALLTWLVYKTKLGSGIRAASYNMTVASLDGHQSRPDRGHRFFMLAAGRQGSAGCSSA